jgi:hypothetical protein
VLLEYVLSRMTTIGTIQNMERQHVTAKVPADVVAEADRIADELGTSRSKLIAWCVEHGVADLTERMAKVAEHGLRPSPGDPWKVGT